MVDASPQRVPMALSPPEDFICPITRELLRDPVIIVETGHTYERDALLRWWSTSASHTCPKTGVRLSSLLITTNWALRSAIDSWAGAMQLAMQAAAPPSHLSGANPAAQHTQHLQHQHALLLQAQTQFAQQQQQQQHQEQEQQMQAADDGQLSEGLVSPSSHPIHIDVEQMEALSLEDHSMGLGPRRTASAFPPRPFSPGVDELMADARAVNPASLPGQGAPVSHPGNPPPFPRDGRDASSFQAPPAGVALLSGSMHPHAPPPGWTFFPGLDSPGGDIGHAADLASVPHGGLPAALAAVLPASLPGNLTLPPQPGASPVGGPGASHTSSAMDVDHAHVMAHAGARASLPSQGHSGAASAAASTLPGAMPTVDATSAPAAAAASASAAAAAATAHLCGSGAGNQRGHDQPSLAAMAAAAESAVLQARQQLAAGLRDAGGRVPAPALAAANAAASSAQLRLLPLPHPQALPAGVLPAPGMQVPGQPLVFPGPPLAQQGQAAAHSSPPPQATVAPQALHGMLQALLGMIPLVGPVLVSSTTGASASPSTSGAALASSNNTTPAAPHPATPSGAAAAPVAATDSRADSAGAHGTHAGDGLVPQGCHAGTAAAVGAPGGAGAALPSPPHGFPPHLACMTPPAWPGAASGVPPHGGAGMPGAAPGGQLGGSSQAPQDPAGAGALVSHDAALRCISASSAHDGWLTAPIVAYNTNGWLKSLLQPMHGWVKWTAETGKGLFVRNDVLLALMQGVLAHVQGSQSAPVQLAGWTFFHGLDSLGGDVAWAWQHAGTPSRLAAVAGELQGVIAFNTDGYLKVALAPRRAWARVELWADKPGSGLYVHNSILWKLLVT